MDSLFKSIFDQRPAPLLKKRLQHSCFPVNIAKCLRTTALKNICERLLLNKWEHWYLVGKVSLIFRANMASYKKGPLLVVIRYDSIFVFLVMMKHCVKSVQIRSFFWSVFSRIRPEFGPVKTTYLDTFHTVLK